MENRRRYYNILRKMNLQEDDAVNQALTKAFILAQIYILFHHYTLNLHLNVMLFANTATIIRESMTILMQ